MKKTLYKNIFREFKFSFSRFLSITILLALGVFVLVGLKSTGTDMRITANNYYRQHKLADAELTSTLPLTQNDRKLIRHKLTQNQGSQIDFVQQKDKVLAKSQRVIRLQNLTKKVSKVKLTKGHMPNNKSEIVINNRDSSNYKLGDWLILDKENNDQLTNHRFKIVGFVTSSDYLDKSELGTTTLKNGRIKTFGFISKKAFKHFQPTIVKFNFSNVHRKAYDNNYERQNQKNVDSLQPSLNDLAKTKTKNLKQHFQDVYYQKHLQLQQLSQSNPLIVYSSQFIQAKTDLQKLKQQIKNIPNIQYTVQSRSDYDYGYNTLGEEAQRIDILANVFPYVFFLVALIVCFTTMSRMATEKREELGLLIGLGYSKFDTIKIFLIYGALSGIIGTSLGAYLGSTFLSTKIYQAYSANYALPALFIQPNWFWIIIAALIALSVAILPALVVALKQLKKLPAVLLQPTIPTKGGKIWLERISFLWNKFSFKYKITFRNIFRYKTRMLMTIIGVLGCTSLLITGFGIRDSLTGIIKTQYQNLIHYDEINLFKPALSSNQQNNYLQKVRNKSNIKQAQKINYQSVYVRSHQDIHNQNVTLLAAKNFKTIDKYVSLSSTTGGSLSYKHVHGIIITQKLAESLGAHVGQQIHFKNTNGEYFHARIGAISKMYAGHFIFMSARQYQHIYQKEFSTNALIIKNNQRSSQKINQLAIWLNKQPETLTVIRSDTIKNAVNYILNGLNNLIFIIIICSSVLALVVLYTLTNINVSERLRELSTMKVLGFYPLEVVMSIFRETIILTIVGIIFGFGGGYWLHKYIMQTLPPQNILVSMYLRGSNLLISTIMTLVFASIVMLIMARKISQVDMLEALKAVD